MNREEQDLDEAISESGAADLMLVAVLWSLLIPRAFSRSLLKKLSRATFPNQIFDSKVLQISRVTSVILLIAFLMERFLRKPSTHPKSVSANLEP